MRVSRNNGETGLWPRIQQGFQRGCREVGSAGKDDFHSVSFFLPITGDGEVQRHRNAKNLNPLCLALPFLHFVFDANLFELRQVFHKHNTL